MIDPQSTQKHLSEAVTLPPSHPEVNQWMLSPQLLLLLSLGWQGLQPWEGKVRLPWLAARKAPCLTWLWWQAAVLHHHPADPGAQGMGISWAWHRISCVELPLFSLGPILANMWGSSVCWEEEASDKIPIFLFIEQIGRKKKRGVIKFVVLFVKR